MELDVCKCKGLYNESNLCKSKGLYNDTSTKHVFTVYCTLIVHIVSQQHIDILQTLKWISNWPPNICYILGKVFEENTK